VQEKIGESQKRPLRDHRRKTDIAHASPVIPSTGSMGMKATGTRFACYDANRMTTAPEIFAECVDAIRRGDLIVRDRSRSHWRTS
jgi:hypothetical protein